jgi:nitroimidazol reductase NimA-like FMN-containing flavoprotein (pyridoxamine 5'-phosphate oxidase superfamily)
MEKDIMRRNDREITDKASIEQFIAKEQIIRIAFYDNGDLYIVPLNYGYVYENDKYTFYFHGAKAGRKYELSKASPNVGFEIDGAYELLEADAACDYSAKFQSVIGTGRLSIIEDDEEKIKGLNALMNHISGKAKWDYSKEMVDAVAVFRLEVDKLSCKSK